MPDALVANAASTKQVRNARKREKELRDRDVADIRFVLSDKRGRRVLWRLLSHSGLYESGYVEGSKAQYRDGRRNEGAHLLALVTDAQPDALLQMMQEAQQDNG